MVDYVCFRVADVRTFSNGVANAMADMNKNTDSLEYSSHAAFKEADFIFQKIQKTLSDIGNDIHIALEVKTHNEHCVENYKRKEDGLKQQIDYLKVQVESAQEELQRALKELKTLQTSAITYTSDPDLHYKYQQQRNAEINSAMASVKIAEDKYNSLKNELEALKHELYEIRCLRIEAEIALEKIKEILLSLRDEYEKIEQYKIRLQKAVQELTNAMREFHLVEHKSQEDATTCETKAAAAIVYGENICNLLDIDHSLTNRDNLCIFFKDIYALDRISNTLIRNCELYKDASDLLQERVSVQENAMQDDVIFEGSMYINDVRDSCARQMNAMRKTASNCKEASSNLKKYAGLID